MNSVNVEVEITETRSGPAFAAIPPAPVAAIPVPKLERITVKEAAPVKNAVAVKKTAPASESGAPRVTIRSRIIEFLKSGPKGSDEVARLIGGANADRSLAGQHLYLLVRDKLAVRNEETNTWSLA
jgi:hypothetical protein